MKEELATINKRLEEKEKLLQKKGQELNTLHKQLTDKRRKMDLQAIKPAQEDLEDGVEEVLHEMEIAHAHISKNRTCNDVYMNTASVIYALIGIHPGTTK